MTPDKVKLKEAIERLETVYNDVYYAWQGRAGLAEDLIALQLAMSTMRQILEGKLVEPMSRDSIVELLEKYGIDRVNAFNIADALTKGEGR